MIPTRSQMAAIAGGVLTSAAADNAAALIVGLDRAGVRAGLDRPHRLAHYLAQLAEESGGWRYDKELATGAEYEGRKDLGNTQAGDGMRFKGRTMGQITGRANYRAFTKWCRDNVAANCPDFEQTPDLLNTDPWEGMGPIWFWSNRKLNDLADENNIEAITKRWNGGLNGFAVRIKFFTRAGLVLLNVDPDDIRGYQRAAQLRGFYPRDADIDGDPGPKTRAAIFNELSAKSPAINTAASPVVEQTTVEVAKPVPVVAQGSDKRAWLWAPLSGVSVTTVLNGFANLGPQTKWALVFGTLAFVVIALFFGDRIIRRVKSLRDAIG